MRERMEAGQYPRTDCVRWVDFMSAAAKSLSLGDHSALAADTIHDGGGWITAEGAAALGRRLLLEAGVPEVAALYAAGRRDGCREGYEAGWRDCLRELRVPLRTVERVLVRLGRLRAAVRLWRGRAYRGGPARQA